MFGADYEQLEARPSRSDAGVDAASDAAAVQFVCRAGVTLCDPFERTEVQGSWSAMQVTEGASLTLDPIFGLGRGLHAAINESGARGASLRLDASEAKSVVRVAALVAFDDYPTQGVTVLRVNYDSEALKIVSHSDGRFEAVAPAKSTYFAASPQKGIRQRIEVVVRMSEATARESIYEVYLSDPVQRNRVQVATGSALGLRGTPSVRVGIDELQATAPWNLFYDDVVVVFDTPDVDGGL